MAFASLTTLSICPNQIFLEPLWKTVWRFLKKLKIELSCCCYLVAKSCPTLCNPMDCSPPGSSVHGILQVRILKWVAISFSRGSSQPRDQTQVFCTAGRLFTIWATREYDSAISLLRIYTKTAKTLTQKGTFTPVFTAALFTIAMIWEQPNYHQWINQEGKCGIYTYSGILSSHNKERNLGLPWWSSG